MKFGKMKSRFPIKRLIILNCWLIISWSLFSFIIRVAEGEMEYRNLATMVVGVIYITLATFTNLGLLLCFEKKIQKSMFRSRMFLIISFSINFLFFLMVAIYFAGFYKVTLHLSGLIYIFVLSFIINSFVLSFQNSVIIQHDKAKSDRENSMLKTANAEAEVHLLRQQIHPHFLFNALSILKSLIKVNPKAAEEYLVCLSDFLRTSVSNNNIKMIKLKDEIKLCRDYIAMQKIRFGEALKCIFDISEKDLEKGFVPSFSIQPLLENAIKHNELTVESPLHINVSIENDFVQVVNNRKLKSTTEKSVGSGLANLSERYRILAQEEVIIDEDENRFSVRIKILKNENCNHRG